MAESGDVVFTGKSGKAYKFFINSVDTQFKKTGGIYAFAKRTETTIGHKILPFYFGQTDDLDGRLPNHEKLPCVIKYGYNCVCIHLDDNKDSRLLKESDLINRWKPACNDLEKGTGTFY